MNASHPLSSHGGETQSFHFLCFARLENDVRSPGQTAAAAVYRLETDGWLQEEMHMRARDQAADVIVAVTADASRFFSYT